MDVIERIEKNTMNLFKLLVSWFTFFVTINWASLGWLAANSSDLVANPLVSLVSYIFAWQNVLGIVTCVISGFYLVRVKKRIELLYSEQDNGKELSNDFPTSLYITAVFAMVVGIIPLGVMWFYIPIYLT